MVHPLVINTDRALNRYQMGNGILGEDCNSIAVDQIRDTMVDLRVNVVRTSCKHDASAAGFFQILKGFLAFFFNILMYGGHFLPCLVGSLLHLR